MNKELNSILLNDSGKLIQNSNKQSLYMGGALVLLNVLLMVSVGMYWTNTAFHQYFTGRPL